MLQQELADALLVTKGNMTYHLCRMEERGLMDRRPEGRKNRLYLTGEGRRLLEEALDRKYKPDHMRADARDSAARDNTTSRSQRAADRKSGIYHPRDPPPATVFDDSSDEEELPKMDGAAAGVRQPQPVRTADARAPPPGAVPMKKR